MSVDKRVLVEQSPKPSNPDSTSVAFQFTVDVFQVLTLLISLCTAIFGWSISVKINNTTVQNVVSRIKPSDLQRDKDIEAILNRMIGISGADRAIVALFTNGQRAHIFPFRYFSVFWEVCNGSVATKNNYQHKPLSNIRNELDLCLKNPDEFYMVSCNDNIPDECKVYMQSINAHTIYCRLIGDRETGYFGIMNLHFNKPVNLTYEDTVKLKNTFLLLNKKLEDG